MRRRSLVIACIAAVAVLAAALGAASALRARASLEFQVRDAVSRRWVWELSMRIRDRSQTAYFQSDAGLGTFSFSRLEPGKATLELSAPGYAPRSLPLVLKRGENRLDEPLDMVGQGIPDLSAVFFFEEPRGGDLACELRPVGSKGQAILNHPCMDLWIGATVWVQMEGGAPARRELESETAPPKGRELFRAEVPWSWDASPEATYRYSALIPGSALGADPSEYRVVEYLVVEADPAAMSRAALGELMARVYASGDRAAVSRALDAEAPAVKYFYDASWNVKAR